MKATTAVDAALPSVPQDAAGRTLRSYLVLPRPGDAVKWWILPLTFGLGVLAQGGAGGRELGRAVIVWLVLELLVYQARYQWNDIRGFEADQRHPDAAGRGRLPGPLERARPHIAASYAVAAARLALAALVAVVLGSLDLAVPFVLITAGVFGVAVVYEALRGLATGRSDSVPPPVRPAIAALWVFVGAGYAVRGITGLALAIDLSDRPLLAAAAVVALWAGGVSFVTGRWALEALAYARAQGGRVVWRAEAGHAREHTLALARWLPAEIAPSVGGAVPECADWRPLRERTSSTAPWNLAFVAAAASAGATGRLLAGPAGVAEVLSATAAGGLLAVVLVLLRRRTLVVVVAAAVALAGLIALTGSPRPLLAALPWLGATAVHVFFASQCLTSLVHPLRDALAGARR